MKIKCGEVLKSLRLVVDSFLLWIHLFLLLLKKWALNSYKGVMLCGKVLSKLVYLFVSPLFIYFFLHNM